MIEFDYTNYRGERSLRKVVPIRFWAGVTRWYPTPQILLQAFDLVKHDERHFAVSEMDRNAVVQAALFIQQKLEERVTELYDSRRRGRDGRGDRRR
jgi:predicted DNA-binding transcriptional regulator YafY